MRTYKLVIGTDPARLELLVNEFIKTLAPGSFEFLGPPQVLHNETFTQAIEVFE